MRTSNSARLAALLIALLFAATSLFAAPRIEYKFWYVKQADNGTITEIAVRVFEGDYQTIMVPATPGGPADAPREVFVRSKRKAASEMPYLKSKKKRKDNEVINPGTTKEAILYGPSDFGEIVCPVGEVNSPTTCPALHAFLRSEFGKDPQLRPVKEQGGPQ